MENYYQFNRKMLSSMGIGLEKVPKKEFILNLLLQALISFFLLSTTIQNFMILVTFDKISFRVNNAFSLFLCGVMGSFKFAAVIRHRKQLGEIKMRLNQLVNELDQKEFAKITGDLNFFMRLARALYLNSVVCSLMFSLSPGIAFVWSFFKNGEASLVLPYSMWYPFVVDKFLLPAYIHEGICGYVWSAAPQAINGLIVLMVAQLAVLFETFGEKLCGDINESSEEISRQAVEYHNELLSISDSLVHIFEVSLLVNVLGETGLICFTAFTITTQGPEIVIPSLIGIVTCLGEVFLLCWISEKLMNSSFKVGECVAQSNFYSRNDSVVRDLQLIIQRSQRQLNLKAWKFFNVKLTLFARIVRTAFSYYTLLTNVYAAKAYEKLLK